MCSNSTLISLATFLPRVGINHMFVRDGVYYKAFTEREVQYTNLSARERFEREVDSLCRLSQTECAHHFPSIIEHDSTNLILGTRISFVPTTLSVRARDSMSHADEIATCKAAAAPAVANAATARSEEANEQPPPHCPEHRLPASVLVARRAVVTRSRALGPSSGCYCSCSRCYCRLTQRMTSAVRR